MSVLFINSMTDTFTPTNSFSTATWVYELCQRAAAEGSQPWVISSDSSHEPYDWKNLVLVPAPRKPQGWIAKKINNQFRHWTSWVHPGQCMWCRRVVEEVRKRKLDRLPIVLSNDIELAVYLRRHFPNAFILHHAHNQNGAKEPCRSQFRASVNVSTAVSDFTREWNEKYYGFSRGEMKTILNGVDTEKFRPADSVPSGLPVINFHSRFDPTKAPDILLRAAIKVAATTNQFALQLVGRKYHYNAPPDHFDRLLDDLCRQLAELGVRVERTGWVDRARIPKVLRNAHINVIASRWDEPSALALYEGMASGLATVASTTGGSPQVVGDAGLLFANENVDELAEHLSALICDEKLRRHYQESARGRSLELTWQHTWRELKSLLPVEMPVGKAVFQWRAATSEFAR